MNIDQLEQVYFDKYGHTFTSLKARLVPNYESMLTYAVDNSLILTDSYFGLKFPPGVAQ